MQYGEVISGCTLLLDDRGHKDTIEINKILMQSNDLHEIWVGHSTN